MDRLKAQIADQPDPERNLVKPPPIVHKSASRTVQAMMTSGFTLAVVCFIVVLGGNLVLKAGSITFAQALQKALPWAPIGMVVGGVMGGFEFYFLRRSRRD